MMKYVIKMPDKYKLYQIFNSNNQKKFQEPRCWAVFNDKDDLVIDNIEFSSVESAVQHVIGRYAVAEGIKQITIETNKK